LFHAERAGQLMTEAGYDKDTIARTKFITQKRAIKRDEDSQTLEDVICLVFLTYYIDSFAPKHSEAKVIDIIQKTWAKMSEDGHAAALKIDYTPSIKETILKALSV